MILNIHEMTSHKISLRCVDRYNVNLHTVKREPRGGSIILRGGSDPPGAELIPECHTSASDAACFILLSSFQVYYAMYVSTFADTL